MPSTVLLLGSFLGLLVSFDHYATLLIPALALAAHRKSVFSTPAAWAAWAWLFLWFPTPTTNATGFKLGFLVAPAFAVLLAVAARHRSAHDAKEGLGSPFDETATDIDG